MYLPGKYHAYMSKLLVFYNHLSPANSGPDWDYIEFSKQCRTKLVSHGDGTYELIMIVSLP